MVSCPPVDCCCQPWSIAPGHTEPLRIDWAPWLATTPGFIAISEIIECSLLDLNVPPPHPGANPADIAIVSGFPVDPPMTVPGWTQTYLGTITEVLIQAGDAAVIGRTYRLNMTVRANDCNGRKIRAKDCVFVYIQQC